MAHSNQTNENKHVADWIFLVTVFVTGASVLVIEIVGTRILAPYFGSGIYTWSALIAITLAALALGYKIGGQVADHNPHPAILYALCATAGIWTTLTFWLAGLTLPLLVQLDDIRHGVIASSFLLFFPNLFLLGTVCPFAITLLHRGREEAGSTSGLIFSISTVGSLLGALGTGFILIPNYGTQTIFAFCGLFLIIFSLFSFIYIHRYKTCALIIAVIITIVYYPTPKTNVAETDIEVIEQVPSFYGQLQILRKKWRESWVDIMLVDGIGQNYIATNSYYTTPYINFISALPLMRKPSKPQLQSLVIGMGAGQLPMLLQNSGLDVEVVEIDPIVAAMAKKHFSLDLAEKDMHFTDGRVFLTRSSNIYDYIIIDAFNADQIAWHLISKEAIQLTKDRLSDDGILSINLTSMYGSEDIPSIQKTLKSVYSYVSTFSYMPDNGKNNKLASVVFLGSSAPIKLSTSMEAFEANQFIDIKHFMNGELKHLEGGLVLTDDFNPISHQREDVKLVWRQSMREYLGEDNLGWLLF